MFVHRVKRPIEKGLQKGKTVFFLHGGGIKDFFLENLYEEPCSLNETLKKYFLEELREEFQYFASITPESVSVFELQDLEIQEVEDFFETKINGPLSLNPGSAASPDRKMDESASQMQENLNNSNTKNTNRISIIKNKIEEAAGQDSRKKFAVLFEDFEWQADLYQNEPAAEKIKLFKDFGVLEQAVVLVSLEHMELLKRYHFENKGSNVIFIGNPSAQEIKYAYLRRFLLNMEPSDHPHYPLYLFEELEEISYAMASSKKSMRDALHVFDRVIAPGAVLIQKEAFKDASEKIIEQRVLLEDVVLDPVTKNTIVKAIKMFLSGDSASKSRKGLILKGPSGTGKTHIVRALATEYNCYFMAPTLSDLKGEYVGQTSGKVKRIFEEARANEPTILFIDEADTVFPSREIGAGGSDSFNLDMVNQFLQEIDGLKTDGEKIFTIAATNRPAIIDSAIKSRLSQEIEIGLPDGPTRIKIFDHKLKEYKFRLSDKSYRAEIEKKSEKMSGRDIDNCIKKLGENIADTPYKEISNLKDDEPSRQIFLKILQDNEQLLIEELRQKVQVEIEIPDRLKTRMEDIIGYEKVKQRIMRQAEQITNSAKEIVLREKYDIKVNKGILLYGPPGNAKTEMAKAAAKENGFYFIKVLSKDFVSKYVDTQIENLQEIFNQSLRLSKITSRYQGVLLFFDEFDALAGPSLSSIVRGTLLDYLANENGLRAEDGKVLFMAATNYLENLDDAVIRNGRIDEHLRMDDPSAEDGRKILKQLIERDDKVENPPSTDHIYDLLHDKKYQSYCRKMDQLERRAGMHAVKLEKEDVRPSGSDIVTLYKEIKADAFFSQVRQNDLDGNRQIRITEDIIEAYFDVNERRRDLF